MVVSGIIALVLGGLYAFLVITTRYSRETEAYSFAQRESLQGISALTRELANSVDKYIDCGPTYIIFLSPFAPQSSGSDVEFDAITGKLLWKKWICYYYDAPTKTLLRGESAVGATADLSTQPTPIKMIADFTSAPASEKRIMAHRVERFEAKMSGAGTGDFLIETNYAAGIAANSDQAKQARVTLESAVTVLNHQP